MLKVDDARSLALLYHLNSEPWMNQEAYALASNEPPFMPPAVSETHVALPGADVDSPLMRLFQRRRSCRSFAPRTLSLEALGELLCGTYGVYDADPLAGSCPRPVPSAGALYPFEILLGLRDVEDLEDGLFAYECLHHRLRLLRRGPVLEEIRSEILTGAFLEHTNAIVVLCGVLDRICKKYGPRGYRYMLLEAGHIAQNFLLLAAERDLATLCIGGFHDARLTSRLGLDPQSRVLVYCIGLGHPTAGDDTGALRPE